jgi:protocatechuate 3,4-dioxygenase beta subunit
MLGKRQVVPVVVTAGQTTYVEIREEGSASNGCRVFGTVRSGERTLPLALVAASAEQLGTLEQVGLRTATTDENGAYQLPGLPPGRYRFSIVSSNGEESGALPVEVPEASEAHRDLLVPAGQVVGTVVDRSTNAPVGGALVQLQPSGTASDVLSLQVALEARANRAFSDDQGRFRIAGVAPGQYTLHAGGPASRASARDYSMTSLTDVVVREGQPTPLTVSLVPGAVVIGRVTDQQRAPIEGVSILLRAPDGGAVDFSPGTRTNGDGRYRYTGVSPGKFMLYAQWEGQVVQATDVFEVKDSTQVERDITLARGIPVTVRLKGIPVIELSDYDVELQDSEGRTYRRILTREQIARFLFGNNTPGEYTVGPFPPGTYSVVVKKNGATVYMQSATLSDPAGETFEVSSAGIQRVAR